MSRRSFAFVLLALGGVILSGIAGYVLRPPKNLFAAVRENRADRVRKSLESGLDPNVQNVLGMTPLHWAASYGFEACAKALIDGGARVRIPDNTGNTPLHFAAMENKREMVSILLRAGADANAQNAAGDTPLHLTAWGFCRASAAALLESGASADLKNSRGETPLFDAVAIGDKQLVELLVRHGATLTVQDAKGNTLADVAGESMGALLKRLSALPLHGSTPTTAGSREAE